METTRIILFLFMSFAVGALLMIDLRLRRLEKFCKEVDDAVDKIADKIVAPDGDE